MTHADAFLQAILDAPDDDAPRLLYADWLDEQGDADRAEFIRVQVALERGGPVRGLRRREQQLLAAYERVWAGPFRSVATDWTFRRGFIESVRAEANAFLDCAGEWFRLAPIRSLHLYTGRDVTWRRSYFPALLADCPFLAKLDDLDLANWGLGGEGLAALFVSPHLLNLTTLNLSGNRLGGRGVSVLANWPGLTRLRRLDLSDNDLTAPSVQHLAQALEVRSTRGDAPCLRSLVLNGNPLERAGQQAVLASPLLRRITRMPAPKRGPRSPR